jgi:hypothetical protein
MPENRPMWKVSAESLRKMYPDSPTDFVETLREYRPLWDDPQKQKQAMKLNYLLKKKKWEPANRAAQAAINLERLLRGAPPNWPVNSVVWNIHKKCFVVSLVNPIPSTGSLKRIIRDTVAELLTASAAVLRRLLMM